MSVFTFRRIAWLFSLGIASIAAYAQMAVPNAPTNLTVDGQPSPPVPVTCNAPPNTPGGSDGRGGCFPGPDNTGVPPGTTLTNYTGSCTISTANTIIDSKIVNCDLTINASGVTIRKSIINGSVESSSASNVSFVIEDSLIDGNDPWACINCGVGYRNFTVLRTEIIGTNRGAYCESNCLIEDSWIHGTNLEPVASNLAHASASRAEQNTTMRHNTLSCDFTGPYPNNELGCSADITGYPDFAPIHHNTFEGNLLIANNQGIGYCAYGGGTAGKPYSSDPANATFIVFRNNVFQRGPNNKCGAYGPVTDFKSGRTGNVWENNRWSDGALVNPG